MKKLFAALVLCSVFATVASAQNSTSPQGGTAVYTGAVVCVSSGSNTTTGPLNPPCTDSSNNGSWFTVMNASLKASTNKTLFVSPSLITGVYTNTQVKGNTTSATSQTATAVASVAVRVLLDCSNCAAPGLAQNAAANFTMAGSPDSAGSGIVFDARIQQLTATLGQAITSSCLNLTTLTNTCTTEVVDLILSTTSAHTFNFILPEVGAGVHTVTIQARLDEGNICYDNSGAVTSCGSAEVVNTSLASSVSSALFGLGSVTILPVQLAPGWSF